MTTPYAIKTALQAAVDEGIFPGAVLAVRAGGQLQFISVAGRLSSDPASSLVEASTIYDLASLTKPLVTVTSIVLLLQQGKCMLDDPIEKRLHDLQGSDVGQATVRDLLSHSSGLPGWRPLYERLAEKGHAPDQFRTVAFQKSLLELIRDEPLIYARASKSLYSDLGFILLGLLIERITSRPLDEWFEGAVIVPFKVPLLAYRPTTRRFVEGHGRRAVDVTRIAPTEWDRWRNMLLCGQVHDENAAAMGGVAGHAGLFGTAESVLTLSGAWLDAYHGVVSLLDHELVREFTTRQTYIPQSSWALGWDTPSEQSSSGTHFSARSFGHLGYTGTSLWIDPQRKVEVVLLSNRVHPTQTNNKIREFRPRIHDLIMQEYGEGG